MKDTSGYKKEIRSRLMLPTETVMFIYWSEGLKPVFINTVKKFQSMSVSKETFFNPQCLYYTECAIDHGPWNERLLIKNWYIPVAAKDNHH